MLEFFRRWGRGGAAPEEDEEIAEERREGDARIAAAEAAGTLPVLDTQHRAIGGDTCHLAVPASLPDHGDAGGKLFITHRRIVFAGPSAAQAGLGSIQKAVRQERDLVIVAGGAIHRFRCNSFGDAMLALWMIDRLRARASS